MIRSRAVILASLCLAMTACTAKPHGAEGGAPLRFARGGVVRVAAEADQFGGNGPGDSFMDPQREYSAEPFELFRCCLQRTLFNYTGKVTGDGGAQLRPDLASSLPEVSTDGLRWTFRLKHGIHYSPPLARVEVTAPDIVRAIKRTARITARDDGGDYGIYYYPIQGFEQYVKGQADSISGLATPDRYTLIVTLSGRVGDLAERFTLAATAPIPALPSAPDQVLGVATGHDQSYGRYQIATGPYMVEGSAAMTPAAPVNEQRPASGMAPKTNRIVLVRNPSWKPATDDLRPAYPDRIEITLLDSIDDILKSIDDGSADLSLWAGPPVFFPRAELQKYLDHPSLGRVIVLSRGAIRYATMNLAEPPFDDVHVRKAANYVVDKQAFINRFGGPLVGAPATHANLDFLEQNQLVNYDPYRTNGRADALAKAKAEMRLSKYDRNGDGVCDASVCSHVYALRFGPPKALAAVASVAANLATIGIHLSLTTLEGEKFFQTMSDPTKHIPIGLPAGWSADFINASNYVVPLFASPRLSSVFAVPGGPPGTFNFALVGAPTASLRRWGYRTRHVLGVDDRINQCMSLTGGPQATCLTGLDQYLMETVVPWVPLMFENHYEVVPSRVVNYSIDQFVVLQSLDQVVVKRTGSPSPTSPSSP